MAHSRRYPFDSAEHDESRLPRWAQERLASLRGENMALGDELLRLEQAHSLLTDRNWFAIHGPKNPEEYPDDRYNLWFLDRHGAHPACSLSKGDVLIVGRKKD